MYVLRYLPQLACDKLLTLQWNNKDFYGTLSSC